jgi:hypothetical protein
MNRWIPDTSWEIDNPIKSTVKFSISFTYRNGFGQELPVQSCLAYLPPWKAKTREGQHADGGFIPCDDFAERVRVMLQYKEDEARGIYHNN